MAFHFRYSNPAAWRCADCRRDGLEARRRCGRVGAAGEPRVVWARKTVSTTMCPRSVITGESAAWVEEFHAWKRFGWPDPRTLEAREAEAMLVLEREWMAEETSRG